MAGDEFARNQDLLHLVGAIVDLKHARGAIEFLDRVIVDEAVAAVGFDDAAW